MNPRSVSKPHISLGVAREEVEALRLMSYHGALDGTPFFADLAQQDVQQIADLIESLVEQVEQAQITAGAEAQIANEEHARAEGLLEQLETTQRERDHWKSEAEGLASERLVAENAVEQLEAAQDRIEELEGWAGRRPGEVAARHLEIWQGWAGTYPASDPFDAGGQVTHVHDPASGSDA